MSCSNDQFVKRIILFNALNLDMINIMHKKGVLLKYKVCS